MIRRPPRSTLFPYTTSSDLVGGPLGQTESGPLPPVGRRRDVHVPRRPPLELGSRRDCGRTAREAMDLCRQPVSLRRNRVNSTGCQSIGVGPAATRGTGPLEPHGTVLGRGG